MATKKKTKKNLKMPKETFSSRSQDHVNKTTIQGRHVDFTKHDDIIQNLSNENRNHLTEKLISMSGATSSELNFDFHDLPYAGLLYAARRFHLGHYKHGRFNWTKGDKAFAEERLKHMMAHAAKFATFRHREDLEAVLCNAMMLADFNERGLLSEYPRYEFMLEGKKITETQIVTKVHNGKNFVQEP